MIDISTDDFRRLGHRDLLKELQEAATGLYDFDMKLDMQALMELVKKCGVNVPTGALSNLPQSDGRPRLAESGLCRNVSRMGLLLRA